MNPRCATHFAISNLLERAATFGLAAVATLSVLAGMDGVADRQYEAALIAQSSTSAVQVANVPADSARSSIPHESV